MKNINVLLVALFSVFIGFAGGYSVKGYRQSQNRNQMLGQFRQGGNGQQFRNRSGGRQVVGEIISQDDKSITVKMMDGSSKIVLISDTASINKAAAGSKDDLKTGEKVAIFGSENSDGSVTAQSIQLNPIVRGFSNSPSPSSAQ